MIITSKVGYLKEARNENLLRYLIKITSNFTGAALGGLSALLLKNLKIKQMDGKPIELTEDEVNKAATQSAKHFSINLGIYSLP